MTVTDRGVAELLERLTGDRPALVRRQAEADRVVAASSAGHLVHEMRVHRRPWQVDPVPLVLDGATFERLAAGVAERVVALERVLADLYGPRTLVADGTVPGELLSSSPRYRVGSVGLPAPARWLTTYAVDVVQLGDGTWRIARDLTDAPTGIGYSLLDRAAMLPVDDGVAALAGVGPVLRRALVANTSVASPRIVLLSGGVEHAGYVEDSHLARLLGFTLVELPDVVVRQGKLWLRSLGAAPSQGSSGGLDPIDVVYRRIDDDETDPIELAAPARRGDTGGGGVPGLLSAVAGGGVVLANAHGCGLVEDESLATLWPVAAEALTAVPLRLPQLGDAARTANLNAVPTFRAGELAAAAVVLRLHAVAGPEGVTVVPGGNGRVLAPGDDPRRPSARFVKDVWVLDVAKSLPAVVTPLPQVDFAGSVPTRAADALFCMGRAAERAEAIARTLRVVAGRRRQDPLLVTADGGRWSALASAGLLAVAEILASDDGVETANGQRGPILELDRASVAASQQLVQRLRAFVADAASVGEFLPGGTSRVLTSLAARLETLADSTGPATAETIDDVLAALAAFAGMWNESTVRGPAWRFGDIGVRVERALVVLALTASLVGDLEGGDHGAADVASLEVLLGANESLVAYRRQHRSDVTIGAAVHLLLRDRDNPRGLVTCLDRIAEHAADLDWEDGRALVRRLVELVDKGPSGRLADPAHLGEVARTVTSFAAAVEKTWFATPVKPMLMDAGRAAHR